MILVFIIFISTILAAFGMLVFRAWQIRSARIVIDENTPQFKPELSFRHIEKIFLYTTKHIIQWIVLMSVKIWFLMVTKIKLFFQNKLPKINRFFQKKESNGIDSRKISFVERAVMESKIKIKRVKEKIKRDHEEETKVLEDEIEQQEEKVDKIV